MPLEWAPINEDGEKGGEPEKKADSTKLDAAGKSAGREAVLKGFKEGKVLTGTTGETYPDYYGKIWDKKNRTRE